MASESTVERAAPMIGEVDALLRTRHALPFWARYSRAMRVGFFAPNTSMLVTHGLGTKPDGVFVVWADASIVAVPGVAWTDTTATLMASAGNAHAVLVFYTLREEPERSPNAENVGKYTPPVVTSGDVTGPAGATDNALTRFDGATGKVIQSSVATLDDTGLLAGATVTTATAGSNNALIANTAFVTTAIANNVGGFGVWFAASVDSSYFGGSGGMAWTVEAGDIVVYAYTLIQKTVVLNFWIEGSTLSGTASNSLAMYIPNSWTFKRAVRGFFQFASNVPANGFVGVMYGLPNQRIFNLQRPDQANLPLGTNVIQVTGVATFEIN